MFPFINCFSYGQKLSVCIPQGAKTSVYVKIKTKWTLYSTWIVSLSTQGSFTLETVRFNSLNEMFLMIQASRFLGFEKPSDSVDTDLGGSASTLPLWSHTTLTEYGSKRIVRAGLRRLVSKFCSDQRALLVIHECLCNKRTASVCIYELSFCWWSNTHLAYVLGLRLRFCLKNGFH